MVIKLMLFIGTLAFDCVNHRLLLLKLNKIGFPSYLINWLHSYLMGRSQRVKFNNAICSTIPVTSGVPQGSQILLLQNFYIHYWLDQWYTF